MTRTLSVEQLQALDLSALPQVQEFPAMQFFPAEWLTGVATMAMSAEQRGAFVDLIAHAWSQKPPCSLPDDDDLLAGYSRLGLSRWTKVGRIIRTQFVKCSDGRLRNPKQFSVWLGMRALREKRRGSRKGQKNDLTNGDVCNNKAAPLLTPAVALAEAEATAAADAAASRSPVEEREETPAKTPDFSAVERVAFKLDSANLKVPPTPQIVTAWVTEYGEELITETLADCESEYAGKHFKYLEAILTSRRDNPNERPGQRRARGSGRMASGTGQATQPPRKPEDRNKFHQRSAAEILAARSVHQVPEGTSGGSDDPVR